MRMGDSRSLFDGEGFVEGGYPQPLLITEIVLAP